MSKTLARRAATVLVAALCVAAPSAAWAQVAATPGAAAAAAPATTAASAGTTPPTAAPAAAMPSAAPTTTPVPPPAAKQPPEREDLPAFVGLAEEPIRPVLSFGVGLFWIKPILALAGGLVVEDLIQTINPQQESRVTTAAMTRFGLEGRLGPYVSFRSEFERNIGAHGTGVWEGTGSFSVRSQYLRLQRWGFTVDAGIIVDEASVPFFSWHTADLLLADHFTRDPILYAGYNIGQGLQASYQRWGFRLGLSFTDANPLSSSASFQVGGAFAGGSSFWQVPLGNFRVQQPDDDFDFRIVTPSLMYQNRFVEIKTMAQVFKINYQTSSTSDPNLSGFNLAADVKGKLNWHIAHIPFLLTAFANFARVENDVLNAQAGMANSVLQTRYTAMTTSVGFDLFVHGRSGFGANYARLMDNAPTYLPGTGGGAATEPVTHATQNYLNIGATYWITDYVAAGTRISYWTRHEDGQPNQSSLVWFGTLRLVI